MCSRTLCQRGWGGGWGRGGSQRQGTGLGPVLVRPLSTPLPETLPPAVGWGAVYGAPITASLLGRDNFSGSACWLELEFKWKAVTLWKCPSYSEAWWGSRPLASVHRNPGRRGRRGSCLPGPRGGLGPRLLEAADSLCSSLPLPALDLCPLLSSSSSLSHLSALLGEGTCWSVLSPAMSPGSPSSSLRDTVLTRSQEAVPDTLPCVYGHGGFALEACCWERGSDPQN